ncbi:hypothetical protein EON65_00440 [archaeon]|nr:MAG: hypothetical protein EON65_00440 [archaeon]
MERLTKENSRKSFHVTHSRLGEVWAKLIVRVMSGRNHDFGNAAANSFYTQAMRDFAAAEHAKHSLIALNGARTNYPKLTHTVMFSKTDDIVRNIQEIAFAYNELNSLVENGTDQQIQSAEPAK